MAADAGKEEREDPKDRSLRLLAACRAMRAMARAEGGDDAAAQEAAKAVWNGWAQPLLDELNKLKAKLPERDAAPIKEGLKPDIHGVIYPRKSGPEDRNKWLARQANDEIRDWIDRACVTFKGEILPGDAEDDLCFDGFIFPCEADFEGVTFSAPTGEEKADGTIRTRSPACFEGAAFHGPALFGKTTFLGSAFFSDGGGSKTSCATFHDDAWFGEAVFKGAYCYFQGCAFHGPFRARGARTEVATLFDGAVFHDIVWMPQFRSEQLLSFKTCAFRGDVVWGGLSTTGAFLLADARFGAVPDLTECDCAQPPRLEDLKVPMRSFGQSLRDRTPAQTWDDAQFGGTEWDRDLSCARDGAYADWARDRDDPAFFRALRLLANRGGHYQKEQAFFIGEVRAQRWTRDTPSTAIGAARLLVGILYDAVAKLGYSIFRPLASFLALFLACFGLHLLLHARLADDAPGCLNGAEGAPVAAAAVISWSGAIPLRTALSPVARASYDCLYAQPGGTFADAAPDGTAALVYALTAFQSLASAILLFLFLLAVRTHFRIR